MLFDEAAFLGALRLLSLKHGWHLRFKGMTYKFASGNSFLLDQIKTVQQISGRSDTRPPFTDAELVQLANDEKAACGSVAELCCGHDCVRILGRALRHDIGSTSAFVNEDGAMNLEKILRLAYSLEQFAVTKLCKGIRAWESKTGYRVVLDWGLDAD